MAKQPFDNYTLYHFSTCMFCLKVRLYMLWKRVKFPTKDILMNANYANELITGGGKKQVPCLRIEQQNGTVTWLYESSDIIRYIKSNLTNDKNH